MDLQDDWDRRKKIFVAAFVLVSSAVVLHLARQQALPQGQQQAQGRRRRQARPREMWVRRWIKRRDRSGQFVKLIRELETEDIPNFKSYMRMLPETFYYILERIQHRIVRKTTNYRSPLSPAIKLAVTLRFLATGQPYRCLQYPFRIGHNTISKFVPEVCRAILDEFAAEVIKTPSTPEEWLEIARGFQEKWNFPHVLGAMDGKHIAIRKPKGSGSYYYNYKKFFSIVLFAVVDSNYKFIYVDAGANGSGSDGGIFNDTGLKRSLEDNTASLPPPEPLVEGQEDVPYFLVGDDAFALSHFLMKPFPMRNLTMEQRIFNYRISRARRVVENVFGILASRFRCMLSTFTLSPDKVSEMVVTCCVLHNILRDRQPNLNVRLVDREDPHTHQLVPGEWRERAVMADVEMGYRARAGNDAKAIRRILINYVNSPEGSVPWQNDMI